VLRRKSISRTGMLVLALVLILLLLPVIDNNEYHLQLIVMIGLNIIIAIGLRTIMTTGQVSFAQPGFMAIGGYMSAVLVMRFGFSFWLSMLVCIIISIIIALAVGVIALRIKGPYFFLASWAFGQAVIELFAFSKWGSVFGGPQGISGVPPPDPINVFGWFTISFSNYINFYYFGVLLLLLVCFLAWRLDKTRIVRIFFSIKESDNLTESVGINTMKYKVLAFIIGSGLASIVGVFYVHYVSYIALSTFPFIRGIAIVAYCIVGGIETIAGPILGASILTFIPEMAKFSTIYQPVFFGILLILSIYYLPDGLLGIPQKLSQLVAKNGWIARKLPVSRLGSKIQVSGITKPKAE
jgi:branched-chain amino acid transport system permease protein